MTTAQPRVLAGSDVKRFSVRSDWQGAVRTALHIAALGLCGWLVIHADGWSVLPAMALLGIVQVTLFAPLHETMHQTAFANRRANAIVGWLAACPSLMNWHFYAAFHLAHHRFTQDADRDPELMVPPPSSLDTYLPRVLALNFWRARYEVVRDSLRGDLSRYPYVMATARPRIVGSVRAMCLFMAALSAVSIAVLGWWAPLCLWIGPQLIGQPFLRLYLLTEHTLCSDDDNRLTNTRTTLTSAAVRLLMWNMNYHTEHHLYPSIPFHRLPEAHRVIRDQLGVVQRGYRRWHAAYLRRMRGVA
jgi:fatty acid desaturase